MQLLDALKPLLASSPLFYSADDWARSGTKAQGNRLRLKSYERALLKRCGRMPPKIGQGGTLDPLAEGVLGMCAATHAG